MMVCPREPAWSLAIGHRAWVDYGSAGAAFLDIRAVIEAKTGFLPVHKANRCPIYDLFLVAN
jgi:hypothetical protein